jgi:phytoene dehydrogenase-like protein
MAPSSSSRASITHASVIGSGPNGLSAAIVLAQAGMDVDVYEAQPQIGGGARTLPLSLPGFVTGLDSGFRYDFGSAIHPMAAGSPFFNSLPLVAHGLRWIDSPAALAHPLDDGTAVTLERGFADSDAALGVDAKPWRRIMQPLAEHWSELAPEILGPVPHLPRHPLLLARFGANAMLPADVFCKLHFRGPRTRALFAGLAAHSFLSLDRPLSSAIGLVLAIAAHAVGWPIPERGAQSITDALAGYLEHLGGRIHPSSSIYSLKTLPPGLALCDISPRQLLAIADDRLSPTYRSSLARFQLGPGIFKVDYALSSPIPWRAAACGRAACVHLGGSFEEIALSEQLMSRGRHAERPFVLLAQPSLFDPSRAPAAKHVAWAYCHIPNDSSADMTDRIENQIERFAPGFRDCILARQVSTPARLQSMDANLIGGDISGGATSAAQTLFRPGLRQYATSDPTIYLCSSSTPPGGGVHGMCGYHAAQTALRHARV